ncbi:MAG: methyltransferase type 11, partial [Bacteroidetes bacterium]
TLRLLGTSTIRETEENIKKAGFKIIHKKEWLAGTVRMMECIKE